MEDSDVPNTVEPEVSETEVSDIMEHALREVALRELGLENRMLTPEQKEKVERKIEELEQKSSKRG